MMFDGVISKPVLKMRGAGDPRDPPAPVRDPPTGTAASNVAKRPCPLAQTFASFRPASRRTEQASRLCYQQAIFLRRPFAFICGSTPK